jgi:hypothetical protein
VGDKIVVTRWGFLGTLAIVAWIPMFAFTMQVGAETLKWRQVHRVVKVEAIQVEDVPGHIIGVAENRGLALFENGEVATVVNKDMVDYLKGSGPHQVYSLYAFEDGSTFALKRQGMTKADATGKTSWIEGKGIFTQGTGRFEGVQGEVTYQGKRLTPLGEGADAYLDFTATYTVPTR